MDCRIEYLRSADGASIASARGGSGAPLVVVPAMVATIETTWATYAQAFPDHEVITYDRRGSGLSERGSMPEDAETYLQDARAVVEGFGLDDFTVIGTLFGTIEAAWLASRYEQRVRHLVLRSPVTSLKDWAAIPAVKAALAALEHDWEFFTESFSQLVVGWGKPNAPAMAARFRAITTREELRAVLDAYMKLDLLSVFSEIRSPTLVEHHPGYFFPDTYSRRIASLIDDCHMAIFSGSDFINDFKIARAFLADTNLPAASSPSVGFQTVLFTDLESSTALTQRLGDEASQQVLRRHDATVRAALAEHGGREVKHTGDGIMASFGSAVGAVKAALRIQRELRHGRIRARVGLNAGEPVADGDDLFGTTVQLAARITGCAAAGQVVVSNVVRELCAGKLFTFEPLGETSLKGFDEPVSLYEVSRPPETSDRKGDG